MMTTEVLHKEFQVENLTKYSIGRVLLMDPCPITRAGIYNAFTQKHYYAQEFRSAEKTSDVIMLMQESPVELVITELSGAGEKVLDGLRMIKNIRKCWPGVPIIVSTTLQDSQLLSQLMDLRVLGIYLKQDPLPSLMNIVMRSVVGLSSASPLAAAILQNCPIKISLTIREIEVLSCLFDDKSVTEIARVLKRDIRTISSHKRNAMRKLGFDSDGDLYMHGNYLSRNALLV